jgi:hypothetical protein
MTSTPTRSSANTFAEPYLNVSNISCASICTSESDRMSSKRAVSKVTVEQVTWHLKNMKVVDWFKSHQGDTHLLVHITVSLSSHIK